MKRTDLFLKLRKLLLLSILLMFFVLSNRAYSTDMILINANDINIIELIQNCNNIYPNINDFINNSVLKQPSVYDINSIECKLYLERLYNENKSILVLPPGGQKSLFVAALLAINITGLFGIHRFYLGYKKIGTIQLCTLGGLGVWTAIDGFRIIFCNLKPKNGNYKKCWVEL